MTDVTDHNILARLEEFYDAVPRGRARVEDIGPFTVFVDDGLGHAFYARPRLGLDRTPSPSDVTAVRARQRELGVPEAIEWVDDTTPGLVDVVAASGLSVLLAPLLVLDPAALPSPAHPVRVLDPGSPTFGTDLGTARAVARVGFGTPGTAVGEAGPAERDAALVLQGEDQVRMTAERVRTGAAAVALAGTQELGVACQGQYQAVGGVAEIVGVATLPAARRRGLAASVTAALAAHALANGSDLVFLSAADEDAARMYGSLGFRRVGTACIAPA